MQVLVNLLFIHLSLSLVQFSIVLLKPLESLPLEATPSVSNLEEIWKSASAFKKLNSQLVSIIAYW